jgi:hypothetical protein
MASGTPPPPAQMMGLITGYWRSQAVGAAARLGLADKLSDGSRSADALAQAVGSHPEATFRLLRALASFGVFEQTGPREFQLNALGQTLRANAPGSMRDMAIAQSSAGHWLPWGQLVEAVKTGKPSTVKTLGAEIFDWYAAHPDEAAVFSGAMSNLAASVAGELAEHCRLGSQTVVDVGGANGLLTQVLLRANPSAKGIVQDLPNVAAGAAQELRLAGLSSRCEAVGGDFFQSVPAGNVYLLKQILHDWNDAQCVTVLRNCAASMIAGGRVLVLEMVLPEDGAPSMAPLMDLNMLVMLPGKERTLTEYDRLFAEAGLQRKHVQATHSPFSIIEAVKR